MKLAFGALLCASAFLPSLGQAQCLTATGASIQGSESMSSTYENVGLYEWDEELQAWVLLQVTYDPYYETETLEADDTFIPASAFWGGGGDGGGVGEIVIQGAGGQSPPGPGAETSSCGDGDPVTLPRVTATFSPPSFGGSQLSLVWRGQWLSGSAGSGVARRPVAVIQAPASTQPVTCGDETVIRAGNAQHALANRGIFPGPKRRGREYTVRYSTGTTETYIRLGTISTTWLKEKPETCKAG